MNILYGIQGTGHGHISRAREIVPILAEKAEIDILISGYNVHMHLEDFPVTHKRGISFAYDSNGSVSFLQTAMALKPGRFIRDVRSLDVKKYDLIISDYEPITAWAARGTNIPSVALSHQASFLSEKSPRPQKKSIFAEKVLTHFAPCTHSVGFHFKRYDSFIYPPVIRKDVRKLMPSAGSHISVYLPAYHHQKLADVFKNYPQVDWHIFSASCRHPYQLKNVWVQPVGNRPFLESMKSGIGVMTSSGFETCAEAMYLNKKLMVIPIKNQYEQLCNAAALQKMGIPVIKQIDNTFNGKVSEWLESPEAVHLSEAADMQVITDKMIQFAGTYPF